MSEIKSGIRYAARSSKLLPTFLIMMVVCTFALNSNVILPVFAKNVLLGDESTYSLLMSLMGLGSFSGALFMAGPGKNVRSKYFLAFVALALGTLQMMTLLGLQSVPVTAVLLVCCGFLTLCFLNRANTRIQLNTDDGYRGRVMSIYVLINTRSTPVGNSLTGLAMDGLGAKYGFFSNGLITFVFVGIFFYIYRHFLKKARVVPENKEEFTGILH